MATRLSSEELSAICSAASASGVTSSHWLRSAALNQLNRERASHCNPLDSVVLAEVMCLRTILLNLVAQPHFGLPTATVHHVIAYAESAKYAEVAKLLTRSNGELNSSPSPSSRQSRNDGKGSNRGGS
jgi:hypothetical protein